MFNFEKLKAWHEAIAFAYLVYLVTKKLPDSERFGLTDQMRRAAVSIASNLAKVFSRSSKAVHNVVSRWRFGDLGAGKET